MSLGRSAAADGGANAAAIAAAAWVAGGEFCGGRTKRTGLRVPVTAALLVTVCVRDV